MNKIIAKRELTNYKSDRDKALFFLSEFSFVKSFDVTVYYQDGSVNFLTDNFKNFPFSIKNEIRILLHDAVDYYNNIINEIEQQQ